MATREQDIVAVIKEQIERFGAAVTVTNVGTVIEVGMGSPESMDWDRWPTMN